MASSSSPKHHVLTQAEIDARRTPFHSDDFIWNTTTNQVRFGPGLWADCQVLVGGPIGGGGSAPIDTGGETPIAVQDHRFLRTPDEYGIVTLDLTQLIPGITAVYYITCSPTDVFYAEGAGYPGTPLNAYDIYVYDPNTGEPLADTPVLITLAAVIG